MIKRVLFFTLTFGSLALVSLSAQQLTRFAVVDLSRVYNAFFRESRAVREFEERSARVQADIDQRTREIQELRARHANAILNGDESEALRIESNINRRTEALRDYYTIRTADLEEQKRQLSQSGTFLDQVHDEIRFIAESEGYSMVINLRENNAILWHSPTVDITDRLIQNLLSNSRR